LVILLVGVIYQSTELRKIENCKINSTEIKVPIFIFVRTMVSTAGVVGFGRPYFPFIVVIVGLLAALFSHYLADTSMDLWDKIILLSSLPALVIECFYYGSQYDEDN